MTPRAQEDVNGDQGDRTTSFGLWRYASEYLKAARILDDVDPNPWVSSSVSYQCACQGLELAFKAYLRASGLSLDDLRNIGHRLVSGMRAAIDRGLPAPSAEHTEAIELIDRYYSQHEFRYLVTGMKQYPALHSLIAAGAIVLDASAASIARDQGSEGLAYRMRLDTSATFGATPAPAPK